MLQSLKNIFAGEQSLNVDTENKEMTLDWLTEVISKSNNVIIKSRNNKYKILKSASINKLEEVFNVGQWSKFKL